MSCEGKQAQVVVQSSLAHFGRRAGGAPRTAPGPGVSNIFLRFEWQTHSLAAPQRRHHAPSTSSGAPSSRVCPSRNMAVSGGRRSRTQRFKRSPGRGAPLRFGCVPGHPSGRGRLESVGEGDAGRRRPTTQVLVLEVVLEPLAQASRHRIRRHARAWPGTSPSLFGQCCTSPTWSRRVPWS